MEEKLTAGQLTDARELAAMLSALPPGKLPGLGATIEALIMGARIAESRLTAAQAGTG